ncbi:MAG: hypothetical protein Q7S22_04810 [Candidatus Micrarchaeota archaeon]|nr:hypothetical protein [Candidatus Micrarchaeota archaeon]
MGVSERSKLFLVLTLVLAIFLSGALGLKTPQECDALASNREKIYCFHEAAITMAYAGAKSSAVTACSQVETAGISVGGDAATIAETEKNVCFADVAKITKDESICDSIVSAGAGQLFQGTRITNLDCHTKVIALNHATPIQLISRPDSLCNIVFIFPFMVSLVILRKKK